MQTQASTLRKGEVIDVNGKIYLIEKIQMSQRGKGGTVVVTNLRALATGTRTIEHYMSSALVTRAQLDERECTFSTADGDAYTFTDSEEFENFTVSKDRISADTRFLQDGMQAVATMYEGSPLTVTLPERVTLQVTQTAPVVAGQSAGTYKSAELSNGMTIQVPSHIENGAHIVVSTEDGAYIERAPG